MVRRCGADAVYLAEGGGVANLKGKIVCNIEVIRTSR